MGKGLEDQSRGRAKENLRNLETVRGPEIEIVRTGPNLEITNLVSILNPVRIIGAEVVIRRNLETEKADAGQNLVVSVDQSPINEFQAGENPIRSSRVSLPPSLL